MRSKDGKIPYIFPSSLLLNLIGVAEGEGVYPNQLFRPKKCEKGNE